MRRTRRPPGALLLAAALLSNGCGSGGSSSTDGGGGAGASGGSGGSGAADGSGGGGALPYQAEVNDLVEPLMAESWAVGMVVGVLLPDGSRAIYGFGSTAASGGSPIDADTLFEIGSVTKTFTSLALAAMVEEGTVTLSQPVGDLLPSAQVTVPSFGAVEISLEHLATHTSALPRLADNMPRGVPDDPYVDYGVTELYAFLNGHTLAAEAGTQYEYSNVAYGLLGHALALTDGVSYAEHIAARVTAPLGMIDTTLTPSTAQLARLSDGHDGDLSAVSHWHFDALAGTGALLSDASDMLHYMAAHADVETTSLSTAMASTHTPRFTISATRQAALAWTIEDGRYIWKNGGTAGFESFVGFDPQTHALVTVLCNVSTAHQASSLLGFELLKLLAGEPYGAPNLPATLELAAADLQPYSGTYDAGTAGSFAVTLDGDALYLEIPGQSRYRLYARATDSFYLRRAVAFLTFDCSSGTCASVEFDQPGVASFTATRQ